MTSSTRSAVTTRRGLDKSLGEDNVASVDRKMATQTPVYL